jgi:LuxR family maltose regulon positive regulatory protein
MLLVAQNRANPQAGRMHDANALLDNLLKAAEADGRAGSTQEILLLQSSLFESQGQRANVQSDPELLSDRELTVLRLLMTELTGPQIAKALFVSVNTLRTHTRHIFDKLDVNSRAAAVRRAREKGLL